MRLRFDFADREGRPSPLQFERPERVYAARELRDVIPMLAEVEAGVAQGLYAAGFLSYEAASAFDSALVTQPAGDVPLMCFGLFRAPDAAVPLDALAEQSSERARASQLRLQPGIGPDAYRDGIAAVRSAIADGETYQINFTFRLRGDVHVAHADALYADLARSERAPYSAFIECGTWRVMSLSPELFFRIDNGRIITQPMKGTAARGLWLEDDDERASALEQSPKNRAENVMIVDLARNDVSQVAEVGSVDATRLFHVDRYPSVLQMVSTVEARVRPGASMTDVFRALFPAGSITGAPKSSSMRLIAQLEHAPRGLYCGAIGYIAPGGNAVFSVAIRTLVANAKSGAAEYGVGGGITWDSTAEDEHAEALSKAACLTVREPFSLIETLRLEDGVPVRIAGHIRRMCASAKYFGIGTPDLPFDYRSGHREQRRAVKVGLYDGKPQDVTQAGAIREAVDAHAREHPHGVRRLRVLMDQRGVVTVESREPDAEPAGPVPIALASSPIDRGDRFLFHKTTNRGVYQPHRAAQPDAFDVLLWNQDREVTEFTTGNVVVEIAGQRVTPARRCGLLAGVFREELLDQGAIEEAIVTIDDLSRATRIWFINSLREWIDVVLAEGQRRSI